MLFEPLKIRPADSNIHELDQRALFKPRTWALVHCTQPSPPIATSAPSATKPRREIDIRYLGVEVALKAGSAGVCVVSGAPMWALRRTRLTLVIQPGAHVIAGQAGRL